MRPINYYLRAVQSHEDIFVGGVMATLLGNEIKKKTGVTVLMGLIDKPGMLDKGSSIVVGEGFFIITKFDER